MRISTEAEIRTLFMATVEGHDGRGVRGAYLEAVADWAARVCIEATLLELLLGGKALITSVEADGDSP